MPKSKPDEAPAAGHNAMEKPARKKKGPDLTVVAETLAAEDAAEVVADEFEDPDSAEEPD